MSWSRLSTGSCGPTAARFAATTFSCCGGWLLSVEPRKIVRNWVPCIRGLWHYPVQNDMDWPRIPKLRFLHSQSAINRAKLAAFRSWPTDEIKSTLHPGQPGALKTRADGTVLDGHHRLSILGERGENIDLLPREIIEREP
jgi:hypothetical protein